MICKLTLWSTQYLPDRLCRLWLWLQLCRLWLRRRPCLLLRLLLLLLGLLPLARGAVSAVMPAWPLRAKVAAGKWDRPVQFLANRAAKTKSGRRHGNELGKCGWVAWAKTLSLSLSLPLSLFTM